MSRVDAVHAWAVRQPGLRAFTIVVRALLALAFVPSGLVKVLDQPFTTLPTTDPVGFFFAGFFSAHGYYRFIGIAQWVAAGLLLFPRTATVGAVLYLPIVANIFAITLAIGPAFGGTRFVTGAMLLANVYLLAWDWDRWRHFVRAPSDPSRYGGALSALALAAAAGLGLFGITGAHLARLRSGSYAAPIALVLAGAALGAASLVHAYRRGASR